MRKLLATCLVAVTFLAVGCTPDAADVAVSEEAHVINTRIWSLNEEYGHILLDGNVAGVPDRPIRFGNSLVVTVDGEPLASYEARIPEELRQHPTLELIADVSDRATIEYKAQELNNPLAVAIDFEMPLDPFEKLEPEWSKCRQYRDAIAYAVKVGRHREVIEDMPPAQMFEHIRDELGHKAPAYLLDGCPLDGEYRIEFSVSSTLYDGTQLWSEDVYCSVHTPEGFAQ